MIRLFKVSIPSSAVALILSESALIFCCYLAAAHFTVDSPMVVFLFDDGGYWDIAMVTGVIILGLYFNDLYENYRVRSRIQLLQQCCLVLGIAFLVQSLLSFAQWSIGLPKWTMVFGSALVLIVVPLWRLFFTWQSVGGQKVLFLGSSVAIQEIARRLLERPELGFTPIGYLDPGEGAALADELVGTPRLGSLADLDEVISEQQPARIVVASRQTGVVARLLELSLAGRQIEDAAATYEMIFGRVPTRDLPPSQLVFSDEMNPRPSSVMLQSAYSLVLGMVALIVALPIMILVGVVVKIIAPGPVFYREECLGLNGSRFSVFRFRSMSADPGSKPGAAWATKAGPHITGAGRWLRRLRLDQLPQLFNVVRGDMALVGPRPERPEFAAVLEEQIPYYRQRLCVKPGMTGWAQINERDSNTIEDTIAKLEYDRFYIKNLSVWLDVYIIFHTIKATLLGR